MYQGFNEHAGWMHTSSGADVVDEYAETIVRKGDTLSYKYGREERPVTSGKISIPYKSATGMATREFTVYRTHHGPVVREADGKWISVKLMNEPVKALTQSYTRTTAKNYREFHATMQLHTIRRTTRSSPTAKAMSLTCTPITWPGVTRSSTSPNRWTAATRPRSGGRCIRWRRARWC